MPCLDSPRCLSAPPFRPARLIPVAFVLATLVTNPGGTAAGAPPGESPAPWPRFHGADGNGFVANAELPTTWPGADYAWCRKLTASDVGSPVVQGGRVYYVASQPALQRIALESVDLQTGELRWSKEYNHPQHHLHQRNTYASSTPAADATHVFATWANPDHTFLKCFDHDGNEIWSRDFGSWQSQHGFASSPRLHGSLVLLFNSQQAERLKPGSEPGQSRMIAVDRKSGETVWETPLTTQRVCYGVPAIFQRHGKAQIIGSNTGNGMFALDAQSGEMIWSLPVFSARCCSTPLILGEIAIGSSGSGGGGNHLVAVKIPPSADEKPQELYRIDRGAPYVPSPVLKGDRLFMIDDGGIASCINARTGEQVWMKRIGGSFGASPIVVGDVMLVISLDGTATTLKASDDFQELGSFELGGPVGATPAWAEGRLLIRVGNELRCWGEKPI